MFIYGKTFENIKCIGYDFPVEDQFYVSENEGIVADGITRDPIGISNFSNYCSEEFLKKYPRPSGATLIAKEICDTFSKTSGTLFDKLIKCNEAAKKLNDKYILKCDYLENDYYGAVASCIKIEDNVLDWAYICDCGIIVYDKLGNVKFQTEDDKKLYSDPYIKNIGTPWNIPETRALVRKDYRNNPSNIIDGKCVSYGALTGEETAIDFIRKGQIELSAGDIVIVYSDGLSDFLHDKDFILQIIDFDKEKFESYIEVKAKNNYEKYGKEKTILLFNN